MTDRKDEEGTRITQKSPREVGKRIILAKMRGERYDGKTGGKGKRKKLQLYWKKKGVVERENLYA